MEKKLQFNIRLTAEAKQLLQALAKKSGVTMTACLEFLLREHAKRERVLPSKEDATTTFDVRTINRLIAAGTPVWGIYLQAGAWVTGRLQRVRRRSAVAWIAQPWGTDTWVALKSYRQVWVDGS